LNLEWRPVGNTRLEIRMPRPPAVALARRETYNKALDRISQRNAFRVEIEQALNATPDARPAALDALVRGVAERKPLLEELAKKYDAHTAAQVAGDDEATSKAANAYEEAMSAVLATNVPVNRIRDVFALPPGTRRQEELDRIRKEFPSVDEGKEADANGKLLTKALAAYQDWAKDNAELEDPSDLKRKIRGAGVLEFRILADRDPSNPSMTTDPKNPQFKQSIDKYKEQLAKYGPRPRPGDKFIWSPIDDVRRFLDLKPDDDVDKVKDRPGRPIIGEYTGRYYVLAYDVEDPPMVMLHKQGTGRSWQLVRAQSYRDPMTGENTVNFTLDARGGQIFGDLTGYNVNRQLCIMLDGAAISAARINERITQHCQISGHFTPERALNLVHTLEAGSLPARVKETPLSEVTIGPTLGETNRVRGLQAALWGGLLVVVFMIAYYGIAGGGVANIALFLNLLFVLAIMALMQATFTLPGVAGLVLTVGMAVDANVLIFERVREERDRGVPFRKALNAGYEKALSTIVDANLTTLITCVILGFVASEEVKGFAIVLGIGIVTSMFTALFVTRLIFDSLISVGWLSDLHFKRFFHKPNIDWMGLRSVFWPGSLACVVLGTAAFLALANEDPQTTFDIEFLGGTSVQVDLKKGVNMTDDQMTAAVTRTSGTEPSAVRWLMSAADNLAKASVVQGEVAGQFKVEAPGLTGDQIKTLMLETIGDRIERHGALAEGHTATFISKPGELDVDSMKQVVSAAADRTRQAASRLRGARVQSVSEIDTKEKQGLSYEIVTTETNRKMVETALVETLGGKLNVQRAIQFTPVRDEAMTREPFFIIEESDNYLSDVIGGDANFDIRKFRGGVAIDIRLDPLQEPVSKDEVERRLREVGLQPEFEQFRTRESEIFPLGPSTKLTDGPKGYKEFAIVALDPAMMYDEANQTQWTEQFANTELAMVKAALGSEKSLSKVVQFAPQIAGQTRNRAVFATVLALLAIIAYVWFRFGQKEYGVAAVLCLVHDVCITLGVIALSNLVFDTALGKALLLEDFKLDLPMVAAILTLIGYSINDTIVVFDRIRENRGKTAGLTSALINDSINQTLSRTVLTSLTVFIVVLVLYAVGGRGVHGFSYVLVVGSIVGTYSSIGVAATLLSRPKVLWGTAAVVTALMMIGLIVVQVETLLPRLILSAVAAVICYMGYVRSQRRSARTPMGQPVRV
jgi:SecD/SecF fusion protein